MTFKPITLFVNAVLSFLSTETWKSMPVHKTSWITQCGLGVRKVGVNLPQVSTSTSSLPALLQSYFSSHTICHHHPTQHLFTFYPVLVHHIAPNGADWIC